MFRFARLYDDAIIPSRYHKNDAGFDLVSYEDAEIPNGETVSIGTGIAIEIPEGYAGFITPRSGLAARHNITVANSPGLIDPGYRGEVRVLLHYLHGSPYPIYKVYKGDRIAQLVIVLIAGIDSIESSYSELSDTVRDKAGFGSTGI